MSSSAMRTGCRSEPGRLPVRLRRQTGRDAPGGAHRVRIGRLRLFGRRARVLLLLALALVATFPPARADQLEPARAEALPPDLPRPTEARMITPATGPLAGRVRAVYWSAGEASARRAIERLASRPALPGLPSGLPSRAHLYFAPDPETWDALTGGRAAEWSAGIAIPALGRVVIPLFEPAAGGIRDRTVLHEWAHLGLHEYLAGLRVPRWFDEGYAQRASGGWRVSEAWRLRLGLAGGGAPPLDSISLDWPRGRGEAAIAYLLAGSAVEYLANTSGDRGLPVFLARWREAGDFEEAFRRTFGYSTGSFETRWAEHVRQRYSWVLVAWESAVFWSFAALALLFLARVRARQRRLGLARLRATELPPRPAYWESPGRPPPSAFPPDPPGPGAEVDPASGPL